MSQIFDALQRSETERAGTDSPGETSSFTIATDLLEAAERKLRGAGALGVARTEVRTDVRTDVRNDVLSDLRTDACGDEDAASPLNRFQSLPVSIPPNSRLVSVGQQESLGAEKFRFLAVRLRQLRQTRPLKKVLITSTIPQEGKSTVAANLACTLARRKQQKTLLLEGDLRRPTVADKFGMGKVPGLSEWLRGETGGMNIYRLEALGLWVLPAGNAPENPLELMQAGKLAPLMDQLTAWFDWIIIDSPPVLPLADTSIWARLADGILLVTRKSITEKQQLQRGLDALERSKLLGALVNSSTDAAHSDYYQRYGPAASSPDAPKVKGKR
jgi:capsular exopolysaccharide synthesis family protein